MDIEVASRVDHAADRRLVRASHDDDEVGACLRHHLRFEVASIHRLQIGNDWMLREASAQLFDRVEPFRKEQRRARFEPIHAGFNANGGGLNRFVDVDQVERELNDGVLKVLQWL